MLPIEVEIALEWTGLQGGEELSALNNSKDWIPCCIRTYLYLYSERDRDSKIVRCVYTTLLAIGITIANSIPLNLILIYLSYFSTLCSSYANVNTKLRILISCANGCSYCSYCSDRRETGNDISKTITQTEPNMEGGRKQTAQQENGKRVAWQERRCSVTREGDESRYSCGLNHKEKR